MSSWDIPAAAVPAEADGWAAAPTATTETAPDSVTASGGDAWGSGGGEANQPATTDETTQQPSKEEDEARARAAGWTKRSMFNYEEFQRMGGNDGNWLGQAQGYEWREEYGEVGPEVPELEIKLFGGEFRMKKGDRIDILKNVEVNIEGPEMLEPVRDFNEAGLHPVVLQNVKLCEYHEPTPIQMYAIPYIMQSKDLVAISQTGSGKTAAYLIPIISKLMGKAKKLCAPKPNTADPSYDPKFHRVKAEPLVVIVVPTRELAIQIWDEARRLCYRSMMRPCTSYGGFPMRATIEDLGKGCDILIATPGRLVDLMGKPHILSMSRVKYTVIDEADEMLHADWEEELKTIMSGGDTNEDADHVYLMFSATFPKVERKLVREYLAQDHTRIRLGRAGSAHKNICQEIVFVDQNNKREAVFDLLYAMEPGRTIIFCNSKATVDLLDDYLYNRGLPTTSTHSDRNQLEREDALRAFRTGGCPILIATGVSARGWDVKDVKHIINYDLPSAMYGGIQEYIHRIGRTARIGHEGLATSFYNERNEDIAQDLVNVLAETGNTIPEFLDHLKPEEGARIQFDDETDDEAEEADGGAEVGGSGDAEEGSGFTAPAGGAWDAEAPAAPAEANGFAADGPVMVAAGGGW